MVLLLSDFPLGVEWRSVFGDSRTARPGAISDCLRAAGAGFGDAVLGFHFTRHDRPILRFDKTPHLPGILVLHFGEFLASGLVSVQLGQADRTQAVGHGSRGSLSRERFGGAVGHPSTEVKADIRGKNRAAPKAELNFFRVHEVPP